jgi:CheY-like chemotaxis protein
MAIAVDKPAVRRPPPPERAKPPRVPANELVRLRDGSFVAVRAATPDDEQALRTFLNGLCLEARHMRFFSAAADLTYTAHIGSATGADRHGLLAHDVFREGFDARVVHREGPEERVEFLTSGWRDSHLRLVPDTPNGPLEPPPSLIRVVVADDHELMRHGLRLALEGVRDIEVVAEADDVASTIHAVHVQRPHVLVLDLRMPGGSGVQTIGVLRAGAPDTRIVALSMRAHQAFARHAIASGASGFVLKDRADSELVQAVRAAVRGESYVSPQLTAAAS